MPRAAPNIKLLFILNAGAGSADVNYRELITTHFSDGTVELSFYDLPGQVDHEDLKVHIQQANVNRVIAVGGDGTVKLVAECVMDTSIEMGIIPAGSANGMAKELGISANVVEALDLVHRGEARKIHLVKINDEVCIHLADIGFNAFLVEKFDSLPGRGMWNYFKATWHAIINHRRMDVELNLEGKTISSKAAMVAIANATMYGTGLKINPKGKLDDELFEVVLVKDYSYFEILKVWVTRLPYNPKKVKVFQTASLTITSKHKVHFQVDGEYIGKLKSVKATLLPAAVTIVCGPAFDENGS